MRAVKLHPKCPLAAEIKERDANLAKLPKHLQYPSHLALHRDPCRFQRWCYNDNGETDCPVLLRKENQRLVDGFKEVINIYGELAKRCDKAAIATSLVKVVLEGEGGYTEAQSDLVVSAFKAVPDIVERLKKSVKKGRVK